jgi:hypothetical protein
MENAIEVLQEEIFKRIGKTVAIKEQDVTDAVKSHMTEVWQKEANGFSKAIEAIQNAQEPKEPKSKIITMS